MNPFRSMNVGSRDNRQGFIIVAVLWILAALATLASIYAIYVANTAAGSRGNDERIQAAALVSAGVELVAYQLTASTPDTRPTRGGFNFQMGDTNVAVEFRSESARIDLNAAPKELLAGLFSALGARPSAAEEYADRIIGWRTKSSQETQSISNEASVYFAAGLKYPPREAPFVHVGELWLVLGIPPRMVERAMPYVTVFSGRPDINILDAAPLVVAALPAMNSELLSAVLGRRGVSRQDGEMVLGLLGPARNGATIEGSKATRVRVRVNFANGRRSNAVVVILILEDGDQPYRILSWRDDADGPIGAEMPTTGLR